MTRPTLQTLSTALLSTILSFTALACNSSHADAPAGSGSTFEAEARKQVAEPTREPAPTAAPVREAAVAVAPASVTQPVLASTTAPTTMPTLERKARSPESLRSPSLVPAGTPEAHIAAFTNLPIAKRDKAPVGGVGTSGIHLDELEVGKGWASSRCEQLDSRFTVDVDERVNVCFRVVHLREAEAVTLEWARDGKVRQVISVHVKPTHAYLTRAWLPVTSGRAGEWTATIRSQDGSVLGQVEFEIAG